MLKRVFQTLIFFILYPKKTWLEAKDKEWKEDSFLVTFFYPIVGCITLVAFVGTWIETQSFELALKVSIKEFIAYFAGFHLSALLLKKYLLKYFNFDQLAVSQQFVVYASSLFYLVAMVSYVMKGFVLFYLFLPYTFYMVWEGVSVFLPIPEEKQLKSSLFISLFLVTPYFFLILLSKFILST